MGWGRDWGDFPPSRPIKAKGGIKAQSQRGEFGSSWWARRWNAVLESFDIGARLNRGRSYARKGQVLAVEVRKGLVTARVQGSRPKPYEVAIQVKTLTAADWTALIEALARQAYHVAKLLAGEMPRDIEEVFTAAGLSLFPSRLGDLATKCSCPDWSNPCKHIAAVYYLLGEEFDRDPFLLFTLRGMDRDELLAQLGEAEVAVAEAAAPPAPPEPLAADAAAFWGHSDPVPDDLYGEVAAPPVPAALPRRLGAFPFWRGERPFLEALESTYTRASARGLDLFVGPSSPGAATAPGRPAGRP